MTEKLLSKPCILIIDDETAISKILCEMFARDYVCLSASSAEDGLDALRTNEVALVISDINMPGITGLEMVPQILALAPDTIVIMMSGMQTIETAIEAMRVGAFDYLMKPFDLRHVRVAVQRALEHHALRLAKRHYENHLEEKVQERTAALRKTTKELQEQIAERNRAEERINQLAYYDLLTDLPNRVLFRDRFAQSLSLAQRSNKILAFLLLSIDRLKSISDTLGPAMADQLVGQIAGRLKDNMREGDTLSYWGSDEFAFLFRELENFEDAIEIARRIQLALELPFALEGREVYVTSSMGVVLYPSNGQDDETLIKNAGAALFQAKERGGNGYQFYTASMNEKALERLTLENSLRRALEQDEFVLYYQPQVEISTGQIVGAEALIRWQSPELGFVSPGDFIPLAESNGLIIPIGEWSLRTACEQNKTWQEDGLPPLRVSVNLSPRQFEQPDLLQTVGMILKASGLDPGYLELELTEGSIMKNPERAIATLDALKEMNIQVAIDDFGSGYSSLSHLKRFPIDKLKIDQSFVREATSDPTDAAIIMAIITLAQNLRLKVVAEGVETEEQLRFLRLLRCDEIQGFLFSKAIPSKAFAELLAEQSGFNPTQGIMARLSARPQNLPGSSSRLSPG